MTIDEALQFLPDLKLTPQEIEVCRLLEGRGLKFCVDFGYSNAFEKHMELLMAR